MRRESTRGRGALRFGGLLVLVGVVYFLLPNLRLPSELVASVHRVSAWIAVAYLVLCFFRGGEGPFAAACRSFFAVVGAVFLILTFLPASILFSRPLLIRAAPTSGEAPAAVVLGGGVGPDGRPSAGSARRTVRAVQLFHGGHARLLLFSTGVVSRAGVSEATAMARFAQSLGVPAEATLLEERSRNTEENARYSAEILRARGIGRVFLVTDALHLRRASEMFRLSGIRVEPVPASEGVRGIWELRGGWSLLTHSLHEYIGIAFYRLKRWMTT